MPQTVKEVRETKQKDTVRKMRPALTPEAEENQMISLAIDLAKRQLIDGTASSQVITHFLQLGSSRKRLESEKLELEKELLKAKTESLKDSKRIEELYIEAIKAMRIYSGNIDDEDVENESY